MDMKKQGKIFLNGLMVIVPIGVTIYICIWGLWGFDTAMRTGLNALIRLVSPQDLAAGEAAEVREMWPGLGFVIGMAAIYLIGLLVRHWFFSWIVGVGEAVVRRLPVVKTIYSSVKDILQSLGGGDEKTRGKPVRVKVAGGEFYLIGLLTQDKPQENIQGPGENRVAVYLPMSYQLGGYTVYVPADSVEEIKGMDVGTLMKLCLTAGIGAGRK